MTENINCPYCGYKNFAFTDKHWCPICGYSNNSNIPSPRLIKDAIIAKEFVEWIWSSKELTFFQEYFGNILWEEILQTYLKKYGFKGLIYLVWEYK